MSNRSALTVEKLSYDYAPGKVALRNVSFEVQAGELVGVVGPNGAGKTTLFLCISGALKGTLGSISVAGLDPFKPAERRELPSKLGILFQDADDQIFHPTVFEDVAFGPLNLRVPPEEVKQRVEEALQHVGLQGKEDHVPFHLSGGEKRRVALAGVLAMQPEILLLDEPSGNLDPRGRRAFIQSMKALTDVTRVIASHDLDLIVETCERCLLLDEGQLIAQGSTRELLSDDALLEEHGLEVPWSLR